jgi:diadenylate cyclase
MLIGQLFDWRVLIDILLMSVGLFFLYRTLQRLGTWGIALGILVAMVVYLLASLLDLRGIEWIFGNFSQVAVIALIIIFQPEIRRIFERAASVRRLKPVDPGGTLMGTLVNALWDLAQRRQGAIVVLPGNEPIQEWLSGGYQLDGAPSLPLIMSIFDPSSPGHDGAAIISKGRITRFGVRLPASQSSRLPEEYGTRHHAGMGLSERSDALVVVVSEERGNISIFKEGKMYTMRDREKLIAAINTHWQETASYPLDLSQKKIPPENGYADVCQPAAGNSFLVKPKYCPGRSTGEIRHGAGRVHRLTTPSNPGGRQGQKRSAAPVGPEIGFECTQPIGTECENRSVQSCCRKTGFCHHS